MIRNSGWIISDANGQIDYVWVQNFTFPEAEIEANEHYETSATPVKTPGKPTVGDCEITSVQQEGTRGNFNVFWDLLIKAGFGGGRIQADYKQDFVIRSLRNEVSYLLVGCWVRSATFSDPDKSNSENAECTATLSVDNILRRR